MQSWEAKIIIYFCAQRLSKKYSQNKGKKEKKAMLDYGKKLKKNVF